MRGSTEYVARTGRTVLAGGTVLLALSSSLAAQTAPTAGPIAKRLCKPRLEWTGGGTSRAEAQRKAIDGWATAAGTAHGEGFTRWALAGIARVSCSLTPDGHRCRAAGSPCRDLTDAPGGKR